MKRATFGRSAAFLGALWLSACGGGGGGPTAGGTVADAESGGHADVAPKDLGGGDGPVGGHGGTPTGGDASTGGRADLGPTGGHPDVGPTGGTDLGTGGGLPDAARDLGVPDLAVPDAGPLPCADDSTCLENRYCAPEGFCTPGCRTADSPCPPDAVGHTQRCDAPTHTCLPLVACCTGVDTCDLVPQDACNGLELQGSVDCDAHPCGAECLSDAECPGDQFCHPVDFRCTVGCRTGDSAACPFDLTCLPTTRACGVLDCHAQDDCKDPAQYCDFVGAQATRTCREGCHDDASCGGAGRCGADHVCIFLCDAQHADCPLNHTCDEGTGRCVPVCETDNDCPPAEVCDALTARCTPGCRDDVHEPDDLTDQARALAFGAADADGMRHAQGDGRMCNLNPDVFQIDLPAGGRIHARLDFAPGDIAYMSIRTAVDEFGGEVPFVAPPGELTFPPLGQPLPEESIYLTVLSESFLGSDYTLSVDLAEAQDACFADAHEPANNTAQGATRVAALDGTLLGSICGGDDDFFVFRMNRDDGLALSLVSLPGGAPLVAELYRASRVDGLPGAAPDATTGPGVEGLDGTTSEFIAATDTRSFSDEDWFIRVRSTDAGGLAEYRLAFAHDHSRIICDTDQHSEPNDSVDQSVDLDLIASLGDGNRVTPDVAHPVPMNLSLCAADQDYFCLIADRDDALSAWVTSENAAGLQWFDSLGDPLTEAVAGGPDPASPVKNSLGRVTAGRYCMRVAGPGGPYTLTVERDAPAQYLCAADPVEADPAHGVRNDTALTATYEPQGGADPSRFSIDSGYLCDVSDAMDEDWYRFTPPADNSALCLTVTGFGDTGGDVDVDLYLAGSAADGNPCNSDDDCAETDRCVSHLCTPPTYTGETTETFEMFSRSRTEPVAGAGEHFLRVKRGQPPGEGVGYRVDVTFTPDSPDCVADGPEQAGANDSAETATPLGRAGTAVCTTWICPNERATGDYFAVVVPAGEDRTIYIDYDDLNDGRLYLYGNGPLFDPNDGLSGYVRSELPVGGHQCLNLHGGATDQTATLQIYADRLIGSRADYSLRIVPTDLAAQPEGKCVTLGGADLPACPSRDQWTDFPGIGRLQPDACWGTLNLP